MYDNDNSIQNDLPCMYMTISIFKPEMVILSIDFVLSCLYWQWLLLANIAIIIFSGAVLKVQIAM